MSLVRNIFLVTWIAWLPITVSAKAPTRAPSPEQVEAILQHHERLLFQQLKKPKADLDHPVSDLETAGYLFFSADTEFDSEEAKRTMARELPANVTLVIYAEPGESKAAIRSQYRGLIDENRLKIVSIDNTRSGFWSRDGLPIAIWNKGGSIHMVDARYYHGFEPDRTVSTWFHANLLKHNYYYEGGNFQVNDRGDCLTVDNRRSSSIPLEIFRDYYGCKNTIRLPFEKGIGHVDESVRFAKSKTVFTDSPSYAQILRQKGFEVLMLPRPQGEYETYVNSLLVNGTMFVPIYGERTDEEALNVYRRAGFKVVPILSNTLSNEGLGSLHCITMTYPPVPFGDLLKQIGAKEL